MYGKLSHLSGWISKIHSLDVEIILVDDFTSEDLSREIEGLVQFHSNLDIKIVSGMFESPGRARNAGLSKATGIWIIFADSDDTLYVGPILNCLSNSAPNTIEVFQFREVDFNSAKVLKPLSSTATETDLVLSLGIWRIAFPAAFLVGHEFTEIRMGEDLLYFLDVFESNSIIHFNPIHGYDYLIGSGSQLTSDMSAVNELTILLGELANRIKLYKTTTALARLMYFKNTVSVAKYLGLRRCYKYSWQSCLMFISSNFRDKCKFFKIIRKHFGA